MLKDRILHRFSILFMVSILIVSCSSGMDETEKVVYRFLNAIFENDIATVQETVDPDYHDEAVSIVLMQFGLTGAANILSGELGFRGVNTRYVFLRLNTTFNNGINAVVHVKGKLRVRALDTQLIFPFESDIPLVRKNNTWYVTFSP